MPKLRDVPASFVDTAPLRWVFEATVDAPIEPVFAAMTGDPAAWRTWFPGFSDGGHEDRPGVGRKRWVKVGGVIYRETVVVCDEPTVWTYRVDETTVPMARALVEEWRFTPQDHRTRVAWTFAIEPRMAFRLAAPVAPRVMRALFVRAMRNLSRELGAAQPTDRPPSGDDRPHTLEQDEPPLP